MRRKNFEALSFIDVLHAGDLQKLGSFGGFVIR
jgi:hypothetical protein